MSASELFYHWRKIERPENNWGLAWYLAYKFCRRYYASHGIVPWVIAHEGLGYYGIQLNPIPCPKNGASHKPLGRMTAGGNVENWTTGSPGDHGLATMKMCSEGAPTEEIVQKAIAHMGIEPIPRVSHLHCRHKRWGAAYELCFEIATVLALRNESGQLGIWNAPEHTDRIVRELDPKAGMNEHMGAFLFRRDDNKLVLAADGRLLDQSEDNIWHQFMNGCSVLYLADLIEERIGR